MNFRRWISIFLNKMNQKNKKGFLFFELILIFVIFITIGGIGWYIYLKIQTQYYIPNKALTAYVLKDKEWMQKIINEIKAEDQDNIKKIIKAHIESKIKDGSIDKNEDMDTAIE